MRQIIRACGLFTLIILIWTINHSCNKKNNSSGNSSSTGLATQPTAQAIYDNQSGGVYKGTITGSSGYFEVNLQAATPFLVYQWTNPAGSPDTLYTHSLTSWTSGQAIAQAVFTASDGSLFWFSVNADGSDPAIDSVNIPSHTGPVYASIGKETSTSLIMVYEGTASLTATEGSGCYNATINIWTQGANALGDYLTSKGNEGGGIGTISGNQLTITLSDNSNSSNGAESGTLTIASDGNSIAGTLANSSCNHTIAMTRIF